MTNAASRPLGHSPLLTTAEGRQEPRKAAISAFRNVRAETERRAAPLSPEDQVVQFLLTLHAPRYCPFDQRFSYLFNSYYVAAGPRHARPKRGLLTRPDAGEVAAYRAHVDAAVEALVADAPADVLAEVLRILEVGLHHEQQHQELILTDILHAFSENPTWPAYDRDW